MSEQNGEIKIIEPEQAASILGQKLAALEAEGWIVLVQHDYMARLTRGKRNLDVEVDLLGKLHIEEKPLTLVQESGQVIVVTLLILLALVALILGASLGIF